MDNQNQFIHPDDIPVVKWTDMRRDVVYDDLQRELRISTFAAKNAQEDIDQSASDSMFFISPQAVEWVKNHYRQLSALGPISLKADAGEHFFLVTTRKIAQTMMQQLPPETPFIEDEEKLHEIQKQLEQGDKVFWAAIKTDTRTITPEELSHLRDVLYEQVRGRSADALERAELHEQTHLVQHRFSQEGMGSSLLLAMQQVAEVLQQNMKKDRRYRDIDVDKCFHKYQALRVLYEAEAITNEVAGSMVYEGTDRYSTRDFALRLLLFLSAYRQPRSQAEKPEVIHMLYDINEKIIHTRPAQEYHLATILLLGGEESIHSENDRLIDVRAFGEDSNAKNEKLITVAPNTAGKLIERMHEFEEDPMLFIQQTLTPSFRDRLRQKIVELQNDLMDSLEQIQQEKPELLGSLSATNLRDPYGRRSNRS